MGKLFSAGLRSSSTLFQFPGFLLNSLPGISHLPLSGISLADAQAQRDPVVEPGMRQIKIAAAVERVHQALVGLVAALQSEANQIQWSRRGQFKAIVLVHPGGKLLRQPHMLAHMKLQPFNPVMTQHKPQLERAKTPSQWDLPVAI